MTAAMRANDGKQEEDWVWAAWELAHHRHKPLLDPHLRHLQLSPARNLPYLPPQPIVRRFGRHISLQAAIGSSGRGPTVPAHLIQIPRPVVAALQPYSRPGG